MSNNALENYVQNVTERAIEFEREKAEKRENKIKEAVLSSEIKAGIAYGIAKETIIARLKSEFVISEEEANKEYEKYAVKTA